MKIIYKSFASGSSTINYDRQFEYHIGFVNIQQYSRLTYFPENIYMFELNNINGRKRCKICSNLSIKTLERRQ